MKRRRYVPRRGDLVWLSFSPQSGHEQAGRRPALVVSPEAYNERVGLALLFPVTHHAKGYPFEVALPPEGKVAGVVLSDQVRNLDWRAREAEFITTAPEEVIREVLAKLGPLLSFP